MKLYTYFSAMEKAHKRATNYPDFTIVTPKIQQEWEQYMRLRDGLIRRFERREFRIVVLEGERVFWRDEFIECENSKQDE